MISDGQARRIAAEWHGGQRSMLCSLATSGFIGEDVFGEIEREISAYEGYEQTAYTAECLRDLRALLVYVTVSGVRPRQEGWSALWDDTPVAEPVRVPAGHHVDGCCETCGRFDGRHDREDCFK